MNKEIEDALHTLLHCSLKDTEYETQFEQYKIVRDYITNLQQENKQLKEELERSIKANVVLDNTNTDYASIIFDLEEWLNAGIERINFIIKKSKPKPYGYELDLLESNKNRYLDVLNKIQKLKEKYK